MKTLFTKPIVIQLQASSLLLGLLLAVATISSFILWILPIILLLKLAIFVLIVLSSSYFIARDALLILPWSWRLVEVDSKGALTLTNKRQQRFKPELGNSTFVHEYCVILNVKYQGLNLGLAPVMLFNHPDNADALRRLRVWLRFFKNKRARKIAAQQAQLPTTQTSTV